jgi:hypothetical protein
MFDELSTWHWKRAKPSFSSRTWRKDSALGRGASLEGFVGAIPLRRSEGYDVYEALRQARAQQDPLLAPHGFFRSLPPGRNSAAIEFVEKFGPLEWSVNGETKLVFNWFWQRHLRYVRVMKLWEERENESSLQVAFVDLFRDLPEIDRAEDADTDIRNRIPFFPLLASKSQKRVQRPWDLASSTESWLSNVPFDHLRETAINILHSELNLHIQTRAPRWNRLDLHSDRSLTSDRAVSFGLLLTRGTLWDYIWELTGLETGEESFWRICPACHKVFYPKRCDQFYCTSREQVLASKRNYARRRREAESRKRMLGPIRIGLSRKR